MKNSILGYNEEGDTGYNPEAIGNSPSPNKRTAKSHEVVIETLQFLFLIFSPTVEIIFRYDFYLFGTTMNCKYVSINTVPTDESIDFHIIPND